MATMSDLQRLARRDVLGALKNDVAVVAIVAKSSIHTQQPDSEPVWPFIKLTAPQALPLRAACVRGATVNFGISAFARATSGETAEDLAGRIGSAVESCLDGRKAELVGVGKVTYSIRDILLRGDGAEPDAMHWSASISARMLA